MSATHHDHPVMEKKPVSFTVPLILAIVTLVFMFAFLSLCDPDSAHHGNGDSHGPSHSQPMGEASGPDAHGKADQKH
jgi:hypothetical protein